MMRQDLSCVDNYCSCSKDSWEFVIRVSLILCMFGMVHHEKLKSATECGLWREGELPGSTYYRAN